MAFFEMHYHSDALGIGVTVNVVLPERAKTLIGMAADGASEYRTLYLLHGLSDDHSIWMRRTSIERYAAERGIAVVMPSVGRSWYTDTAYGEKYLTFVSEELPRACQGFFRGMSTRREDNFVAGLSMGGYGALKVAITHPESFGGCASLSGALDIAKRDRAYLRQDIKWIFGEAVTSSSQLRDTEHDLFYLTRSLVEQGKPVPKIFLWCGDEDDLLGENRTYRELLEQLKLPHEYRESEGNHAWKWWDLHIQAAMDYLLEK